MIWWFEESLTMIKYQYSIKINARKTYSHVTSEYLYPHININDLFHMEPICDGCVLVDLNILPQVKIRSYLIIVAIHRFTIFRTSSQFIFNFCIWKPLAIKFAHHERGQSFSMCEVNWHFHNEKLMSLKCTMTMIY